MPWRWRFSTLIERTSVFPQGLAAGAAQPAAHAADTAAPKRKGKGPAGPALGKGTAVVRAFVDAAAVGASEGAADAEVASG